MTIPILVLMDLQEAICRESGALGGSGFGRQVTKRQVLAAAAGALATFRQAGAPVVHVRVAVDAAGHRVTSAGPSFRAIREKGLLREGDPQTEFCAEVAPIKGEPVVNKGCVNPFIGTQLQHVLNRLAPTELVFGGVATNYVVESATRHAADSGYKVVVLEDLCASGSDALHDFSVQNILPRFASVTTSKEYFSGW